MFAVDGMLDAEGGALLRSALDALMGPPERDDSRTTSQRWADALAEMAQRQLDQGELPQRGCQRPHLMLVAQMATLSSEPGAPAAELESGQPVPGEMARRIACNASLSPAESGEYPAKPGEGVPRRVGPRSRGSTRRSRGRGSPAESVRGVGGVPGEAGGGGPLRSRYRGVGGVPGEAGGGGPASRCGKTCLSNLVLVCRRCHRAIHEGGWRLAPDAGGAMRVTARPP